MDEQDFSPAYIETLGIEDFTLRREFGRERGIFVGMLYTCECLFDVLLWLYRRKSDTHRGPEPINRQIMQQVILQQILFDKSEEGRGRRIHTV